MRPRFVLVILAAWYLLPRPLRNSTSWATRRTTGFNADARESVARIRGRTFG